MSTKERREAYEYVSRNAKLATTYAKKAARLLHVDREVLPNLPTDYWTLLDQAIETATDIVKALPDDFFESTETPDFFGLRASLGMRGLDKSSVSDAPYEAAQKLVAAMEERRKGALRAALIARLEDTTGRTPEEAALYLAKAAELRG